MYSFSHKIRPSNTGTYQSKYVEWKPSIHLKIQMLDTVGIYQQSEEPISTCPGMNIPLKWSSYLVQINYSHESE